MKTHEVTYLAFSCFFGLCIGVCVYVLAEYVFSERSIEWNGGIYTGETRNEVPDGDGRFEKGGMTYSGKWTAGRLERGKVESRRYVYEGELMNFMFNGYGVCRYKDGSTYWGYWKQDKKDGLGHMEQKGRLTVNRYKDGIALIPPGQRFRGGERVYGIDVSVHQGTICWQDVFLSCNRDGGVDGKMPKDRPYMQPVVFAIAKSTQGSRKRDRTFLRNMEWIRRCGICFGAYHFLTLNASGKRQAWNYIRNTRLQAGDMPPVLDLEKNTSEKPVVTDEEFKRIIPIAREWIDVVERHYGVTPVLYTNMDVYEKIVSKDVVLAKCPLWIANPGTQRPDLENCVIWQFSHHGKVNGVKDNVADINMFYGDMKAFRDFLAEYGIKTSKQK